MDDFAKTTPAFGYSKKLNKIVFKNHEAFWMCVIASERAGMMSDVPFDYDDSFLKFMVKQTGIEKPNKKEIADFLQGQLLEALNIRDSIGDDHFNCFRVDGENPDDLSKIQPFASKGIKDKSWSESVNKDLSRPIDKNMV